MILVEQSAYGNRWRKAAPVAKAAFSLLGMAAAFLAASPEAACAVALVLAVAACGGAGIPPGRYLRVAGPSLLFLLAGGASLAVSLSWRSGFPWVDFHLGQGQMLQAAQVCGRSLACLAALLFLTLTTPLVDILGLLRRCGLPAVLLDLMSLCYRTLFVFSDAAQDMVTAQAARLGYASPRHSLRSLGGLIGNLTVQILYRSQALHRAALARNHEGPLLFLRDGNPSSRAHLILALLGGAGLLFLARML